MSVTYGDLVKGFRELGIRPGMAVECHSSLSSFGWVEGGADAILDALEEVLTEEGTLVLPSFNHGKPYGMGEVFDIKNTATTNGKIPDTFWRRPDVKRGMNPTHAYAAWGKNAARYTESQQSATGLGLGSPLARMWEDGGYVLLLGTGYGPNTFHHFVEQREAAPCLRDKGELYEVIDENGERTTAHTWSWRNGLCPKNDGKHPVYEKDLEKIDSRVTIGDAVCILYPMREGYEIIAKYLREGTDTIPPCKDCPVRPRVTEWTIPEE